MEVFVPGRLCVLGEHTDWAGNYRDVNQHASFGMTIVCATNEGLYARCSTYKPMLVKYTTTTSSSSPPSSAQEEGEEEIPPPMKHREAELSLSDIKQLTDMAQEGDFFSYVAGTILSLMQWDPLFSTLLSAHGLAIDNYRSTLPMQKGLSSSAAVCVLVASCFSTVHDLNISTADLMEIAYRGEMFTPSQCGRMDQCVAMGKNTIGLMTFTDGCTSLVPLSVKTPLYFVVADLQAHKDTVVILNSLNKCYPFPKNAKEFNMHTYTRNNQDIAWQAIRAIETGDVSLLASATSRAQQSFDSLLFELCPQEFASPALRKLFADPGLRGAELYLSVKGVGSNGDGTVQFLCASKDKQTQLRDKLNSEEYSLDAFALTIPATPPAPPFTASGDTGGHRSRSIHSARVNSAVVLFSYCGEEPVVHMGELREFLLHLMSCGISAFALVFEQRRTSRSDGIDDNCSEDIMTRGGWSFDARRCGSEDEGRTNDARKLKGVHKVEEENESEEWDYYDAIAAALHSMIRCCLYYPAKGGKGDRGGEDDLSRVLERAAMSVLHIDEGTAADTATVDCEAETHLLLCHCRADVEASDFKAKVSKCSDRTYSSSSPLDSVASTVASTLSSTPDSSSSMVRKSTPFAHLFAYTFEGQGSTAAPSETEEHTPYESFVSVSMPKPDRSKFISKMKISKIKNDLSNVKESLQSLS